MMNPLRRWLDWCGPGGSLGSEGAVVFVLTGVPMVVIAGFVAAPPVAWMLHFAGLALAPLGPFYLSLFP